MADTVEAGGENVDEEAADELLCGERHRLVSGGAVSAIILVLEGDAAVVGRDEPAVGEGAAVGVAREIGQHRRGSAERALAVDVPLNLAQRRQKGGEARVFIEKAVPAEELQLTGGMGGQKLLQHQAAKQF